MSFQEKVIEYGPKLLKAAALLLAGFAIGMITMARIKDKAYKELLKKHDKETAKRMAKEFDARLRQIKKEQKDNEEMLKKKMKALCEEFGIDPEIVYDV